MPFPAQHIPSSAPAAALALAPALGAAPVFPPASGAGAILASCALEGGRPAVFHAAQGTTGTAGTSPGGRLLMLDDLSGTRTQAFFTARGFGHPDKRP